MQADASERTLAIALHMDGGSDDLQSQLSIAPSYRLLQNHQSCHPERQRRICFLFAFNEKQQMLRFGQHDMRTFATAYSYGVENWLGHVGR
jgi:hypothetical protein